MCHFYLSYQVLYIGKKSTIEPKKYVKAKSVFESSLQNVKV